MPQYVKTVFCVLAATALIGSGTLFPAAVSRAEATNGQTPILNPLTGGKAETGGGVSGSGQVGGSGQVSILPESEIHQPFFVGFPDGNFHPQASFTRAEAATVVAKVKKLPFDGDPQTPYTDVDKNHWAYKFITSVTKAGYMKGYGNGTFRPDEPISRAELVALVLQVRAIPPVPNLAGFTDTADHWAKDLIATAKSLGFVSGVGDNKFLPDDATERQVAAKMFGVAFLRGPLVDGDIPVKQHFPDVKKEDWSFGWVEEASVEAHESMRSGLAERLIRYRPDVTERY